MEHSARFNFMHSHMLRLTDDLRPQHPDLSQRAAQIASDIDALHHDYVDRVITQGDPQAS